MQGWAEGRRGCMSYDGGDAQARRNSRQRHSRKPQRFRGLRARCAAAAVPEKRSRCSQPRRWDNGYFPAPCACKHTHDMPDGVLMQPNQHPRRLERLPLLHLLHHPPLNQATAHRSPCPTIPRRSGPGVGSRAAPAQDAELRGGGGVVCTVRQSRAGASAAVCAFAAAPRLTGVGARGWGAEAGFVVVLVEVVVVMVGQGHDRNPVTDADSAEPSHSGGIIWRRGWTGCGGVREGVVGVGWERERGVGRVRCSC